MHTPPSPPFSDELRKICRERLTRCLADLATRAAPTASGEKRTGTASDGEFWVSKVLATIAVLQADTKHVQPIAELDEEATKAREEVIEVATNIEQVRNSLCTSMWNDTDIRPRRTSQRWRAARGCCWRR